MTPPDLKLPDDVETLKAMVLAMAEKAARADALESEVADLDLSPDFPPIFGRVLGFQSGLMRPVFP